MIAILLIGIGVGIWIGKFWAKISNSIANKKINKGGEEVLKGERENKFDLDGKLIDVKKFKLRNENGKEYIIDLDDIRKQNNN